MYLVPDLISATFKTRATQFCSHGRLLDLLFMNFMKFLGNLLCCGKSDGFTVVSDAILAFLLI